MSRRRHTPEQIVRKLREADRLLGEGTQLPEVMIEDYYRNRPHRAHGMMTPTAFKTGWETAHDAARASTDRHSPYGLASLNAGADPNLARPTNHQLSQ